MSPFLSGSNSKSFTFDVHVSIYLLYGQKFSRAFLCTKLEILHVYCVCVCVCVCVSMHVYVCVLGRNIVWFVCSQKGAFTQSDNEHESHNNHANEVQLSVGVPNCE